MRSLADLADLVALHRTVLGSEMDVLPRLTSRTGAAMHLIARTEPDRRPVAALSVIETTGDRAMHKNHGLAMPPGASAARYSHMAVVPEFRGLNIPLLLMLEAQRLFVLPRNIQYTWLVFDAARAFTSNLCKVLGYRVQPRIVETEFGPCCVLAREESAVERSIQRAPRPFRRSQSRPSPQVASHLHSSARAAAASQLAGVSA